MCVLPPPARPKYSVSVEPRSRWSGAASVACRVATAQAIDGSRARHHQQPCRHDAARGVVAGRRLPGLREDLLRDVFGIFLTPAFYFALQSLSEW